MALHRLFPDPSAPLSPGRMEIGGEEARHAARVKRLGPGDSVEVLDGRGGIAAGRIAEVGKPGGEWAVVVDIAHVRRVEPTRPRLDIFSPAPKGPRMGELIDGISQAGAASWAPLITEHTVREAGEGRLDRIRRIAAEASKQCGRPWLLTIGEPADFGDLLRSPPAGARLILADAIGTPYEPTGAEAVALLVGPEGGWSASELEAARAAGVALVRFGPHVMRIETAVVAGAAVILDREGGRG